MVPEQESDAGAEWTVIALLLAAAAAAVMFVLIYVLDLGHSTQFLGLALGASFGLIAAALIVVSRRLVPQENLAEDYSGARGGSRASRGAGAAAPGRAGEREPGHAPQAARRRRRSPRARRSAAR